MTDLKKVEDYYKLLVNVLVQQRASEISGDDPTVASQAEVMAFADIVLQTLEDESWTSDPQTVFFRKKLGRPAREVTLPVYSILEEEGGLHLFSFHYDTGPAEPQKVDQKTIEQHRSRLEQLVELLRDTDFEPTSLGDDPAVGHLSTIKKFLKSDRCRVIRYFVITNHRKSERNKPERVTDGKVFREVIDIDRLFKWAKGVASRSDIEVAVPDYLGTEKLIALRAPSTNGAVTTYLTVVPGKFLAEMYENFDNRLLELNVRSYLSAKGKVNKGIQDTLKDPAQRGLFLPYNNGVVMVVEELHGEEAGHGAVDIKWMKGIQIVNGGQTTASLFKARRDLKGDPLEGVHIQAKIVKINDLAKVDELVKAISRYANLQNKVEMADLGANEAFHRRLERLAAKEVDPAEKKHWFYERMRSSYATELMLEPSASARKKWQALHPKERVITKTDLAKAMLAWDRQPWIVAKGGQKCFNAFAQSHHVKPIQSDEAAEIEVTSDRFKEIIGKMIVYRTVHQIIRADRETFQSNQINIATFTVAYIARRVRGELDWKAIWRQQTLSDPMKMVVKAWARRVDEFIQKKGDGKKLLSEVCKREPLFDEMYSQLDDLALPNDGKGKGLDPVELRGRLDFDDDIDVEDEQTIAEVMSMSPERVSVIRKAAESNPGVLSEYRTSVIATVAALAREGWQEKPKQKQAKMFLKALATLESFGLIDSI